MAYRLLTAAISSCFPPPRISPRANATVHLGGALSHSRGRDSDNVVLPAHWMAFAPHRSYIHAHPRSRQALALLISLTMCSVASIVRVRMRTVRSRLAARAPRELPHEFVGNHRRIRRSLWLHRAASAHVARDPRARWRRATGPVTNERCIGQGTKADGVRARDRRFIGQEVALGAWSGHRACFGGAGESVKRGLAPAPGPGIGDKSAAR